MMLIINLNQFWFVVLHVVKIKIQETEKQMKRFEYIVKYDKHQNPFAYKSINFRDKSSI